MGTLLAGHPPGMDAHITKVNGETPGSKLAEISLILTQGCHQLCPLCVTVSQVLWPWPFQEKCTTPCLPSTISATTHGTGQKCQGIFLSVVRLGEQILPAGEKVVGGNV